MRSRGWPYGIHWPLVCQDPQQPLWFSPEGGPMTATLEQGCAAVRAARDLGAAYVLFHFPWPGLAEPGADYCSLGWYFVAPPVDERYWRLQELMNWSERLLAGLLAVAKDAGVEVILEVDGPSRWFFARGDGPDRLSGLLGRVLGGPGAVESTGLSLCVDTGRLGLLALTHGRDPLELVRPWLPFCRHVHLHAANWALRRNHVPVLPSQKPEEGWVPAAAILEEALTVRPDLRVVLEHNPGLVGPEELEESHRFVRHLVGG